MNELLLIITLLNAQLKYPRMAIDREELARTYYRVIDTGSYDDLVAVLDPDFIQERSDRTFEGRERFIHFMREERPMTDTTHVIDAIYRAESDIAIQGRLRRQEETLFDFVDVFSFTDDVVARIDTFTR